MNYSIQPAQIYEWTINNLHTLPVDAQNKTLENLRFLKWIPDFLEPLNYMELECAKQQNLLLLADGTESTCLMSMSCFVYNLKLKGVDVSDLEEALNTNSGVRNEIKKRIDRNQNMEL